MRNPTKSESLNRKLASTARATSTNQVPLPGGISRLLTNLYWLSLIDEHPVSDEEKGIINAYYSLIKDYPIGSERSLWSPDALQQQEQELREITELYRTQLLQICNAILEAQTH